MSLMSLMSLISLISQRPSLRLLNTLTLSPFKLTLSVCLNVCLGVCLGALLSACSLRTECLTGMTQCSDDASAILTCERGFWVEGEVCAEGQHCMNMDVDASSDEHGGHTEVVVMCMAMSAQAGAEAGAEGGASGGVVDHSGHSLTLTPFYTESE